jgi:hypothetical protein
VSAGPAHQRIELCLSFANALQICEVPRPPQILAALTITYQRFTITVKGDAMYTLPVDEMVKMQVSYVDSEGNPAAVDGPVAWASSDETIVTVTPESGDSTIVTVFPVGPVGQVQITATADADLGAGVSNLITVCDIQLVAGEAISGTIAPVGPPTPKP